ncbi:MAG: CBO0543 family protein [Bacillota bacterium]|nr:CBO0543 family protein [Bacillota bacterium]
MHVVIVILVLLASFKWGNWNNWREYHASMLFITAGGLLYEYIVKEFTLWNFHTDFLFSHEMTVILYALIAMPVSILIFLSHFPERKFQQLIYIFLWSGVYILIEYILNCFGRIEYKHGWSIWHSFLFDLVMFSVIALHHHSPFRAYLLSIFITIFLIDYFNVPFVVTK